MLCDRIPSDSRSRQPRLAASFLLLFPILLGGGCTPPRPPGTPPLVASLDRSAACSGSRWIGVLKEAGGVEVEAGYRPEVLRCPEGWEWLFLSAEGSSQSPPPGLQRFCVYLGEGDPRIEGREVEDAFVSSPVSEGFERVERDCRIVGPAAESFFPPEALAEVLRARFLHEARGAPNAAAPGTPAGRVRLVVVDSVEDAAPGAGVGECPYAPGLGELECSPHGQVLVTLARELLCTGAGCAAEIGTRRVLRWSHEVRAAGSSPNAVELGLVDPAGETRGGSSGTPGDLATAIRREVAAWWAEGEDRPRLVLNLSVGWEPFHGAVSPPVRAALEDAVCRGALVIAAAGNRVAGPAHLETPLLPAAWEREPAPSAQECAALLETSAQPPQTLIETPYRPLVYAVGGVESEGRLLSNARPGATPRLVAFGDHASIYYPGPPARHETLTGTSVSTLVVSAAAALGWSRRPGRTSFDLMSDLSLAGAPGGPPVDFCLEPDTYCPPGGAEARRIYLGAPASPWQGTLPFNDREIDRRVEAVGFPVQAFLPSCDPRVLRAAAPLSEGAEPCPQRLYDVAAQPWLGPQPGANHNPDCTYTQASPGTIVLEFDPRFRVEGLPATLSDLTLLVAGRAYRLSNAEMTLGAQGSERYQVVLTGFHFGAAHPMYLAATVNGKHATLTPLLQVLEEAP